MKKVLIVIMILAITSAASLGDIICAPISIRIINTDLIAEVNVIEGLPKDYAKDSAEKWCIAKVSVLKTYYGHSPKNFNIKFRYFLKKPSAALLVKGQTYILFMKKSEIEDQYYLSYDYSECEVIRDNEENLLKEIKFYEFVKIIMNAKEVASDMIGEDAIKTPEFIAFNKIMNRGDKENYFCWLYKSGNSIVKFYALVGLYLVKDQAYDAYKTDYFKNNKDEISFMNGCVKSKGNPKDMLEKWCKIYENALKK